MGDADTGTDQRGSLIVVADLSEAAVERGAQRRRPVVLDARGERPSGRQLERAAVGRIGAAVDAIGHEAETDAAAVEDHEAADVAAVDIAKRADAIGDLEA